MGSLFKKKDGSLNKELHKTMKKLVNKQHYFLALEFLFCYYSVVRGKKLPKDVDDLSGKIKKLLNSCENRINKMRKEGSFDIIAEKQWSLDEIDYVYKAYLDNFNKEMKIQKRLIPEIGMTCEELIEASNTSITECVERAVNAKTMYAIKKIDEDVLKAEHIGVLTLVGYQYENSSIYFFFYSPNSELTIIAHRPFDKDVYGNYSLHNLYKEGKFYDCISEFVSVFTKKKGKGKVIYSPKRTFENFLKILITKIINR